jgi:hypothetical protein
MIDQDETREAERRDETGASTRTARVVSIDELRRRVGAQRRSETPQRPQPAEDRRPRIVWRGSAAALMAAE